MPITQDRIYALVMAGRELKALLRRAHQDYMQVLAKVDILHQVEAQRVALALQPTEETIEVIEREYSHYFARASDNDRKRRYMQKKRGAYQEGVPYVRVKANSISTAAKPKITAPINPKAKAFLPPGADMGLGEVPTDPDILDDIPPELMEIDTESQEYKDYLAATAKEMHKSGLDVELPLPGVKPKD